MKEIRLSKSCIGREEKEAVNGVLERQFLGMGADVEDFEHKLEEFFGRTSVCVSNGTAALQLALQASSISRNDEVLVQSITYVASVQAISALGAKPIFCEVDPNSFTIDIKDAESKITESTKAIMPVHYGGNIGSIEKVYKLAEKYSLRVIEDAAHAFGGLHNGERIGSFGDIVCFSFDGIKNITSGEGGCIVSSDEEILDMARDARLLGVLGDTKKRYNSERSWEYNVAFQGWRYHMSNIMAAIGIEQLKKFQRLSYKRKQLAELYKVNFEPIESIKPIVDDFDNITPHIYPIVLDREIDRDGLRKKLLDLNVQTGIHYFPNHKLSFYARESEVSLPITEKLYKQIVSLPLHPDLDAKDVELVSSYVSDYIRRS